MAVQQRGVDMRRRNELKGSFSAVPTQDTHWSKIGSLVGGFARVDDLPKVFVFLVRNGDLVETLPDIVSSIESLFGFGQRLSLRVIDEVTRSGRSVGPSILRLGIESPASLAKARHLMSEFDEFWDQDFESRVRGRILVNYDY
jgi:hypothetical protein